jgi:glycosyltransferase involved in cell wall biosynthesis
MSAFAPCVNLRTLGHGITGVQRYLSDLLPHMPSELASLKPARPLLGIKGHLWEQFCLPVRLGKRLLWSPGNTGPIGVSRQVLTVHDLASLDHPEWFNQTFARWYAVLLPILIRKVRAIITVSKFSKERILERTGVSPERVHVIPNGIDPRFRPADADKVKELASHYGLTTPYVLSVGSLEPRKNLRLLLDAWRLGRFDGATLVIVGASSHVFAKLELGSFPDTVRLLGRIADEALPVLYSGAAGFVYPSVYEGFGFPPLEALACGCPLLVSDIPVHREVCLDAGQYFDPGCAHSLVAQLDSLLRLDRSQCNLLKDRGIARAAAHRWEQAAHATWQVIRLAGAE